MKQKSFYIIILGIVGILMSAGYTYMPWIANIGASSVGMGSTLNFTGGTVNKVGNTITVSGLDTGDNLGNHTATQTLSMAGFNVTNGNLASYDSVTCNVLNSDILRAPTTGLKQISGTLANPEGNVFGNPGDIYRSTTGVTYIKRTGTTSTGWGQILTLQGGGLEGNSFSGTTDPAGDVVVSHNLGTTSFFLTGVTFQGSGSFTRVANIISRNNSNFTLRIWDADTKTIVASTSVTFDWGAIKQ